VSKDYPEKKDKIGLWYCIGYAIFVVCGVLWVMFDFETIPDDILLQMITVETIKVLVYGLFAVMITIAIGLVCVDGIITYHKNKRRRDWN